MHRYVQVLLHCNQIRSVVGDNERKVTDVFLADELNVYLPVMVALTCVNVLG